MSQKHHLLDIDPKNYQRAFFFERLGYLLMDFVHAHYRQRDFLTIYSDSMLGTYIRNEAAAQTLTNGREIFASQENFTRFESGFRDTIVEGIHYINYAREMKTLSIDDLFDLRALIVKLYYYFEKTEFFFTDGCYKGKRSQVLKQNLLVLGDELKMQSRPLLIELLTTVIYRFAELAAIEHHLSGEDVRFYSFDELLRLLETGTPVDQQLIEDRKVSYVVYYRDGSVLPIDDPEKSRIIERFKAPDYAKMTEFTGTIASKGRVTARARVILPELDIPYHEFVKKLHALPMNQGEILVTETTSPDFVPLMKKAGGIIANQGGLNSHAAIMSRELRIPCLVGTYHATHILTTGDLIELDANTGNVRILEKASTKNKHP